MKRMNRFAAVAAPTRGIAQPPAPPRPPAPPMPPKPMLHPKMAQRAVMVAEAHQHLAQAIPGFNGLPARQRMMATQEHVRTRMGKR